MADERRCVVRRRWGSRRRRGWAVFHVLLAVATLSAVAASWRGAFSRTHATTVRGAARAQAREAAEAAWTLARGRVRTGRDPSWEGDVPGGRARVRWAASGSAESRRLVVTGWAWRPVGGEELAFQLLLDLDAAGQVLARREVGP